MTEALSLAKYPGNVAKYRLALDMAQALRQRIGARVLDVGCVGPGRPLELWRPFLEDDTLDFRLVGVDVAGIDETLCQMAGARWSARVELLEGSAYELDRLLGEQQFEFLVSTQVLEHLARYPRFIAGAARHVLPGGEVFLTLDSAHFGGKFPARRPALLGKRVAKALLARLGNESHYDIPLYDRELEREFERAGLAVRTRRYYNLGPLKALHNHVLPESERDRFLETWWELEEMLNRATVFGEHEKSLFRCLYYHLRKSPIPAQA
ncbi:MAG: class I SAM-dependent methyltransferase [Planctomycetes bacterium]|nr:class I SAM-dependent methyltransferase [Planctomycetota bacterium]